MGELRSIPTPPKRPAAPPRLGSALLVLAGASLFGTIGTAQALGPAVPAPQLAGARLLLAAALLTLAAVGPGLAARRPGEAAGRADGRAAELATGLGRCVRSAPTWWAGIGQVSFNLCFLGAVRGAGVAVGTLVAIGATPVLTGLAGSLLGAGRVTVRWLQATGVAVAGLVVLVTAQLTAESAGTSTPTPLGILLALGASASYATYILAGNAASARGLPTQPYLAVAFGIAAVVTMPLLVSGDVGWLGTVAGALLVAYLAAVPTVAAYSMFNRGLKGVRSSTASTLGLVEPVVAALLAYALLGERLSLLGLAGAALVLTGLVLVIGSTASREPAGRSSACG